MSEIVLTREQSRAIDAIAMKRYGFSGLVLMENAGRGVAEMLLATDPTLANDPRQSAAILCGKGNNAGDGFVIARHLEIRNVTTHVVLLASPQELPTDARANYDILRNSGAAITDLTAECNINDALISEVASPTWVVDAMLGTGAHGEPREPMAAAICWMNAQQAQRLAVDVPSGLDCDTGEPADTTVRAHHTCTFVANKLGFLNPNAQPYLGQVHVTSIGLSRHTLKQILNET